MNQTFLIQLSQSDLESLIANTIRTELSQLNPVQEPAEPEEDELLRVPDLQRMFGVSKQTVLAWSKAGKLPTMRMGGRIYFRKGDVVAALKGRRGKR